jgi:HK97 gp10 family phage protein
MADTFSIRTTGLKEAQKAIYSLGQQFGDFVVYKSERAGANIVLREIRENAPVKTGKLKKGIVLMKSKINRGRMSGDLLGMTITIRKRKGDPFYGRFQEDGWKAGKTHVPAKHFIEKAFLAKRVEAVEMIVATATAAAELLVRKQGL